MKRLIQGKVTIQRGKITAIEECDGSVELLLDGKRYEFPDAWVSPGLVDSHAHIIGLGTALDEGYLSTASSKEECIELIREHAKPRHGWIVARGWNHERWFPPEYPTAADLDEHFPAMPVVLTRIDGHALWVNTCALQIAGVTASTSDPVGGQIFRDESGIPTGILLDNAMTLILQHVPPRSNSEIEAALLAALRACSRVGLTEIHDMDVLPGDLALFTRLAEEGKLPCRVLSWVRGQNYEWHTDGILPTTGELHRIVGIKLFADGALGSHGAALLEPYADNPFSCGLMLLSTEDIIQRIECAIEDGFSSIAVHAIGDRAVRTVLDAIETIHQRYPSLDDVRFRIEHSQVVHPDDIERYAKLGVIASVQPIHCLSDAAMAERRLGDRVAYAYRWRSFLDHGVLLCAGSDFPVESHNPLLGIDAFCRRGPFNASSSWHAAERLEPIEALDAYTINAHRAADMSYRRGRLQINMDADLTIFDRNIIACPLEEILSVKVLATVVGGTLYLHV